MVNAVEICLTDIGLTCNSWNYELCSRLLFSGILFGNQFCFWESNYNNHSASLVPIYSLMNDKNAVGPNEQILFTSMELSSVFSLLCVIVRKLVNISDIWAIPFWCSESLIEKLLKIFFCYYLIEGQHI